MSSPCPILTPINLYHFSLRFLTTIQSSWNTQPHAQQSIEAQHTSWGQGCSHFVVKSLPFRSNSAPFRVILLSLRTSLTPTRNKVGILHSLVSSNQWTDRAHQPRVRPVPMALCEQTARQLVRPLTHGRVPAQQSCPLYYLTASISAWHQMAFSYGLWTPTEPFWSRDSQWVHGKNENSNLQSTERHKKILQLMKNSGSSVQT